MRMQILRIGLVTLAAAGIAGCGGEEPGQQLSATSTAKIIGELVTTLGQLPQSNNAPAMPQGTGLTLLSKSGDASAMATDCETVTPANLTDADGDGIALTKTGTFDCVDKAVNTSKYTRKGKYTVTDLNDNKAGVLGGLRVDYNLDRFESVSADGSIGKNSYVGFWDYKSHGVNGFKSTSDFTGKYYYKGTTANYEYDYVYNYTWDYTMTPDNPADATTAWNAGSLDFTGTYKLNGKFMREGLGGGSVAETGLWVITYKSKNLKYDRTCTKFYKSGSVIIDDGNSNEMELRYDCNRLEFYVNNVKSDWYTAQ